MYSSFLNTIYAKTIEKSTTTQVFRVLWVWFLQDPCDFFLFWKIMQLSVAKYCSSCDYNDIQRSHLGIEYIVISRNKKNHQKTTYMRRVF